MDFQTLFKRIEPHIRFIARRYRRSSPLCEQDDLYQEICLYLWQTFKESIPQGMNDTYIVKGCEFHILNFLRKKREKTPIYSIDEPLSENGGTLRELLPDTGVGVDEVVERRLAFNEIRNNQLRRREKEVIEFLLEGCTVREIGKRIGTSHVAVVKIKKRIIERWQKHDLAVTIKARKLLQ